MIIFNKIKRHKGVLLLLLFIGLLPITSCDKDFGDINESFESNLYKANIPGLFNNLIASLSKNNRKNWPESTRYRVPVAWLYHWNQLAAMYTASGFRLDDKTTYAWRDYYTSLANSRDIERLIGQEANPNDYTNTSAMVKTVMAYKVLTTTLLYGDMPYTEAGKGFFSAEAYRPVYDTQQSIFESALNDLTWAVDNLSADASQISLGDSETLLGNDIDKWIIFANSLRLRYAMTMRDKNPGFADAIITAALNKPLLAADEHISLDPANISDLKNDREGFYRGNTYIRMGSTMWDAMSSTNEVDGSGIYDLRCKILFEPNDVDEWVVYPQNPDANTPTVTGDPNHRRRLNNYDDGRSNFAAINLYYTQDQTLPQFIITGTQISFIKAEIYNRGIGVAANPAMADSFYKEGITASVNFWYNHAVNSGGWVVNKPEAVPTEEELETMLTNPNVVYSADAATALSQIYKQSWISLFHQPFEAWTLQRRTNNATPNVPLSASSLVQNFNRLTYPPSERETNRANWQAASGGNDLETNKMWIQP